MKNKPKGQVVMCSFLPKPGKQQELLNLLQNHVPTLRMLGFATGHPRSLMLAENGAVIEIFEWESQEAAQKAHEHPEVKKIWEAVSQLAESVPLASLPETQKPFAHFKQAANDRTNRVIHFEIEADNPEKVSKFYADVFGWQFYQWGEQPYWLADTGREPFPGIDGAVMKRKQPQKNVTNTISVDSLDASIKKVEASGGKLCVPRMAIAKVGYLAYCSDPDGIVFGMMEMDMDAQ